MSVVVNLLWFDFRCKVVVVGGICLVRWFERFLVIVFVIGFDVIGVGLVVKLFFVVWYLERINVILRINLRVCILLIFFFDCDFLLVLVYVRNENCFVDCIVDDYYVVFYLIVDDVILFV